MAAKLDLGKALSQAAQAAGEIAKDTSAAIESAAKGATNAAEGAGNVIVDTATSASEAIGSAMCSVAEGMSSAGEQIASSDAGKTITGAANTVGGIAIGAAVNLAQGASSLASDAASTVEGGINAIKENSFSARLRRARIKGFRDGIKQGAYLAGEKRHNFIYRQTLGANAQMLRLRKQRLAIVCCDADCRPAGLLLQKFRQLAAFGRAAKDTNFIHSGILSALQARRQ